MKKNCQPLLSCMLTLSLGLSAFSAGAAVTEEKQATATLKGLYHSMNHIPNFDMTERLDKISGYFLGRPYVLGALGEGSRARFDQYPRYRTDAFDCETYVTTILAIALANNEQTFKHCLRNLRYSQGKLGFIHRNHFTGLDWNQNNQRQGYVKDITTTIVDKNKQPVFKTATAFIDKPSWYAHFGDDHIRLLQSDPHLRQQRLHELQALGSKLPRMVSNLPYLPFTALFDARGKANQYLFKQIPEAAIVEIVRPNWNLRKEIGTNLNVSHLGFVFWKNGTPVFRQASSQYGKVVDVPLIDYLSEARSSPTIKGINIQIVLPSQPLSNGCHVRNH